MRKAKAKHRPDLEDWEGDGLFEVFPSYLSSLSEDYEVFIPSQQNDAINIPSQNVGAQRPRPRIPEEIPVVLDADRLTPQQFSHYYEARSVPAVIRNIPAGQDGGNASPEWPALRSWNLFALEKDPDLRERPFKCGEDDDGNSIKVKLKHFLKYLQNNHDDSPLYIFDSAFEDDKISKRILSKYLEIQG